MKTHYFFTVFVLLMSLTVSGQWSTDPSVNNVIADMSGEEVIPKIATAADGTTYIGWFSNESGNYNVRLQKLDVFGNLQWDEAGLLISDHTSMSWLTDWDMTVDAEDHAILCFQDIRNSGNNNIYAYRISPDGEFVWGADGLELSNSTAFDVSPKVVVTNAGNIVVAWQSDEVIIRQKIAPDGTLLWGANGITMSGSNTYSWPQLLPVGDDDVIMKFFEDSGPSWSPTRHVFAQRYDEDGNPVWAEDVVISNAGGISAWTQIFPFINDGNDGFYIAWHDDRDNNSLASIYMQHVGPDGQVLLTNNGVEVSTMPNRNHFDAELGFPPGSDDIFVFWNEMDGDQNNRGIYGQKISSSGDRLWTDNGKVFIEISPVNVFPFATRNSDSDMIVVYEEFSSAVNSGLKAMRIDTDGNYVWTEEQVDMCTVQSEKGHPAVNNYMNAQWIAVWEDHRSGNADIYGQNIQPDGSLGPVTVSGEVEVYPDTLFFNENQQTDQIHIVNNTTDTYTITNIDEYGEYCWMVTPYPELPYDLAPGDSLILDVYIDCITLNPVRDYVYEPLHIMSESDTNTVIIAVDESLLVGLEEYQSGMLKVYPNPSRGGVNFYLDTSVKEDARLSIYNALGKEINSVRLDHGQSYLWSGTAAGTYYYKLVSDGIMETGKVILLK
jgi:hypothetical protein